MVERDESCRGPQCAKPSATFCKDGRRYLLGCFHGARGPNRAEYVFLVGRRCMIHVRKTFTHVTVCNPITATFAINARVQCCWSLKSDCDPKPICNARDMSPRCEVDPSVRAGDIRLVIINCICAPRGFV